MSQPAGVSSEIDAEEAAGLLLRDLRSTRDGLSTREAQRRLVQYGPNELRRRGGHHWPGELARQLTHPLALLLWVAAALSLAVGSQTVAIAVLLVIVLNAGFAFVQELQAEQAVEALARYMPQHATVLRDGTQQTLEATQLVPGDVVLLAEGDRVAADMRLLSGAVEVDLSTLTGESAPAARSAEFLDTDVPRLAARDLVFSGTSATGGEARAVVFATGMHTELGRIAALSERVKVQPSPLERQVRRVAWLIAAIAVAMAVAFVPLAIFGAGLSLKSSVVFAVGLLAGNVPEGLLPVITLALAVAVRLLARRGALVKRLSAVETLGSTDVICTDKTGTLTENRMRPFAAWTLAGEAPIAAGDGEQSDTGEDRLPAASMRVALAALAEAASACNQARLIPGGEDSGDPTEVALLHTARFLGADVDLAGRERRRRHQYNFDPRLKLMSTLDALQEGERANSAADDGEGPGERPGDCLHTKGAPEAVLARCTSAIDAHGRELELQDATRARVLAQVERYAQDGLRVLALARRSMPAAGEPPARELAERELCFLGLVTMFDPPREQVADAVARCHSAGIRIIVITGDHPLTAAAIAQQVGIGGADLQVVDAERFDHRHEREIEQLLAGGKEVIFARASPEVKLQIGEALRAQGHVVAMTGDGVNDAPALRSADIGVAMGRSGTDVAREAATMVLTDDNFATIVTAVEAGRRVYDNVRKFIVYIFAHATPEVAPFLVFALAGGAIPLPLPVLLLLAFDVGTETLPSLALGREPAEPGIMARPPRRRSEGVIRGPMLVRAWLFLGALVAALSLGCFFIVLTHAGWRPGDATGAGTRFHHAYLQATTMTFLGMIAGQIGTAFAVRTQRASLRSIGVFSNRSLLLGVAVELLVAAVVVYAPPLQSLLGTAGVPARDLLLLLPCPVVVWGADELRRSVVRRKARGWNHTMPATGGAP
ncbi:MAG TPA: cation-transporting P-type ATPase [Solirubrobacteraceae bacterium]|nr:cation-transporting P-type ATPase [Solirubrobacteraceae bacterium]